MEPTNSFITLEYLCIYSPLVLEPPITTETVGPGCIMSTGNHFCCTFFILVPDLKVGISRNLEREKRHDIYPSFMFNASILGKIFLYQTALTCMTMKICDESLISLYTYPDWKKSSSSMTLNRKDIIDIGSKSQPVSASMVFKVNAQVCAILEYYN